jgi:Tetratricopeptide repeat
MIRVMNSLATSLHDQGELGKAVSMNREVLEKRKRILSDKHPSTITAMSNLANSLGDQGNVESKGHQ